MTRDQLAALHIARAALLAALNRDLTRPARHPQEDLSEVDLPLDALALAVAAYLEARGVFDKKAVEEVKNLRDE